MPGCSTFSGLIAEGGDELMAEILIGNPFTHYLRSYRSHSEFKEFLMIPDRNLADSMFLTNDPAALPFVGY